MATKIIQMSSFTTQNRQVKNMASLVLTHSYLLGGKIISPFAAKDTSGNKHKHYKQKIKSAT